MHPSKTVIARKKLNPIGKYKVNRRLVRRRVGIYRETLYF